MTSTGKQNDDWGAQAFLITKPTSQSFRVMVKGRARWALECLIAAGAKGCTPINTPGPRWSHYVWLLRGEGIEIETVTEKHGGPFAGSHARYVLRSNVTRAPNAEVAA